MVNEMHSLQLQISGHYLASLNNIPVPSWIAKLRDTYGLRQINPVSWYPAHDVISFFAEIGADEAGSFDLVDIGRKMSHAMPLPAYITSGYDALAELPYYHTSLWRGGNPGQLEVKVLSDHHMQLHYCDQPLPVDLIYGICYGLVERFAENAENINVQRVARGRRCNFDIRW